jgi:hypothetical protein
MREGMFNREEASRLVDAAARTSAVILLKVVCVATVLVVAAFFAGRATAAERGTSTTGVAYDLIRSGQFVKRGIATSEACETELASAREKYAATKTSGSERWVCRQDRWVNVSYGANAVTCPAAPAPRSQACPTGYTGQYSQVASVGSAPECNVTWTPTTPPPGACQIVSTSTGSATLNWQHDGQNVEGFRVVYGTSPTALTQVIQIPGPNVRTASVSSLSPGTYYFAVKAYQGANESATSNVVSKVVVR